MYLMFYLCVILTNRDHELIESLRIDLSGLFSVKKYIQKLDGILSEYEPEHPKIEDYDTEEYNFKESSFESEWTRRWNKECEKHVDIVFDIYFRNVRVKIQRELFNEMEYEDVNQFDHTRSLRCEHELADKIFHAIKGIQKQKNEELQKFNAKINYIREDIKRDKLALERRYCK
ncbi:uncharacterized protein VNE69_04055 [Vairimorpha necatrix]|uniref:Uncharacterized protein n=1 Tax=Vairimorpha necatrix TaxID=6039 RepID=A0AAX4JBI6_9MICR